MPFDSVILQRLQIERIVRRGKDGAEAEFVLPTISGPWFCCRAWTWPKVPLSQIQARATAMTTDQAHAVSIALQMAVEWIALEMPTQ